MLDRKGMIMNHKKLYRLCWDEKLGVRQLRGRTGAGIAVTNAGGGETGRKLLAGLPFRHVQRAPSVPHSCGER